VHSMGSNTALAKSARKAISLTTVQDESAWLAWLRDHTDLHWRPGQWDPELWLFTCSPDDTGGEVRSRKLRRNHPSRQAMPIVRKGAQTFRAWGRRVRQQLQAAGAATDHCATVQPGSLRRGGQWTPLPEQGCHPQYLRGPLPAVEEVQSAPIDSHSRGMDDIWRGNHLQRGAA